MTFADLVRRNLRYHWRGNLAVFLGIALGSAILTGALLVGDSLRGSLKALTLDQLGWIDEALVPGRFFSAELAAKVSAKKRAPALVLQASAGRPGKSLRVGKVTIFGVDASFWPTDHVPVGAEFWSGSTSEVVLPSTLAEALGVQVGDEVVLNLEKADNVPRESLLGTRKADEIIQQIRVKVKQIIPDEGMARFSLKPTPVPPRNAFVPIGLLHRQKRLDLDGRINAIFVAKAEPALQASLQQQLTLADWGLRYRSPSDRAETLLRFLDPRAAGAGKLKENRWKDAIPDELAKEATANGGILTRAMIVAYYEKHRDYYSLESQQMLLSPHVIRAVKELLAEGRANKDEGPTKKEGEAPTFWKIAAVMAYLADTISDGKTSAPYVVIAGIGWDCALRLDDNKIVDGRLADDEVLLMRWPGSSLAANAGDQITVDYYVTADGNQLKKDKVVLRVKEVVPIEGDFDDPDFTPDFPGITDKPEMDWDNPPFPYDPKRVRKLDKDYWKRYRTTPRAYVRLATAQRLWSTRFGDITSLRVRAWRRPPEDFPGLLLRMLKPEAGGFVFQPLRKQALDASSGSADFAQLFLGFSSFLILSALLLIGLLVRLNLDRRAAEMGLLLATGWEPRRVRWLLLAEGSVLAAVGSLAGLGGAVLYADSLLKLLARSWPGGAELDFLHLHVEPVSFAIGYASSLLVTLLTLVWATRALGKLTPRALLAGETVPASVPKDAKGWMGLYWMLGCSLGAAALALAAGFLPSEEARAGGFFSSGALLLTACLILVWKLLKSLNRASSPQPTLARLGIRNAGRHAVRSELTVGLLAAASFVVVAVECFHKSTDRAFASKSGGSGGFAFYADASIPVFEDLNDAKVRVANGLDDPDMRTIKFFPCRLQPGDDASCLNLYKALQPRVLGIPEALIQRGGFQFAEAKGETAAEKANPWLLLQGSKDAGIPAIVDANTAQWILKVGLGDTIEVNNDSGEPVKLRIVGLLQESIFQSEVLISNANFLKLYPRQQGFSFFLIDVGTVDPPALPDLHRKMADSLGRLGMDVQTTASRLQGYLAVENTYLATFQALGGLGLILGALGLAIVLLRGVWERRAELALLQALGFRPGQLAWLVLAENAFLLVMGLAAGTLSALLAVAPHLIGSGAHVLWLRLAVLLVIVLAAGFMAAALAIWSTLRTPVLTALRRE